MGLNTVIKRILVRVPDKDVIIVTLMVMFQESTNCSDAEFLRRFFGKLSSYTGVKIMSAPKLEVRGRSVVHNVKEDAAKFGVPTYAITPNTTIDELKKWYVEYSAHETAHGRGPVGMPRFMDQLITLGNLRPPIDSDLKSAAEAGENLREEYRKRHPHLLDEWKRSQKHRKTDSKLHHLRVVENDENE